MASSTKISSTKYKKTGSVGITLFVIMMLILSGPASAVTIAIDGLSLEPYTKGSEVNFQISVKLEDPDSYVPISNFTLGMSGPDAQNWNWNFTTDGTILNGNAFIIKSIEPISQPGISDFGYGYGYGVDAGYGYSFGYGYGYGYGSGVGGGTVEYIYDVTLNTTTLDEGEYTIKAGLNTGNNAKPSFTSPEATFAISAPITRDLTLTADSPGKTTINFVNATYTLNLTNTGDAADTFDLKVINMGGAAVAALDKVLVSLDAGASDAIMLDVTGMSGSYTVNVTAISQGDTAVNKTVSTTTTVTTAPYFAIGSLTVNEDASGTTSLYLNNAVDIGSFDVNVTFSSTVANLTGIAKGTGVEELVNRIDNTSGVARIGGFNVQTSMTGNVKLADLTFKAVGAQGNSTLLGIIVNSLANANAVPITELGVQTGIFEVRDITRPVIHNVTLNRTEVGQGESILVTVNASDNVGVTRVAVSGGMCDVNLSTISENIWEGEITAKSALGTYTVTVTAYDGAGLTGSSGTSYKVVDVLPPVITIFEPINNTNINIFDTRVRGAITDDTAIDATLYLNDLWVANLTLKEDEFSQIVNYTAGIWNHINVTAVDSCNNSNTSLVRVFVLSPVYTETNVDIANDSTHTVNARNKTDSVIELETGSNSSTVNITVTASDNATALGASETTVAYGLAQNQRSLDRYVQVNVTGDVNNVTSMNLTLYYTDADLDRNGDGDADDPGDINEQSLKLYWYNPNTSKWMPLVSGADYSSYGGPKWLDGDRNTVLNYLWAKVDHFSTFALVGDVVTAPVTPSGGGGGGSYSPTSQTCTLTDGVATFTGDVGLYVQSVEIPGATGRITAGFMSTNPTDVGLDKHVFKYLNINAGDNANMAGTITFRVSTASLTSKDIDRDDVALYRFSNNQWNELSTSWTKTVGNYEAYSASAPGFSYFAIAEKGAGVAPAPAVEPVVTLPEEVTPTPPEEVVPTPPEEAVPTPPEEPGKWLLIIGILIVIAIAVVVYLKKEEIFNK